MIMEYMESKMQDRLEASMSEYEQMEDEIQTLREQLAIGKRLLSEQMELTNERTKICIELRSKVAVLVEYVKRISAWNRIEDVQMYAREALATYDKLSEDKHDTK